MTLSIRPATSADAPLLAALIHELAEFEHLNHESSVSEDDILLHGFGPHPKFRAVIAEWNGEVAGYALFFEFFSSFQGCTGLLIDDIFVREKFRKNGIGRALLAHVAAIAFREKYFCLRWEVLDWNTSAIEFYKKLGAVFLDEWRAVCLIGEPLQAMAETSK